jgi:ribosomal protein S27AE
VRDDDLYDIDGRPRPTRACPRCGDPLRPEILDDERMVIVWTCFRCGIVDTRDPTA